MSADKAPIHAPIIPIPMLKITRIGKKKIDVIILGKIKNEAELIPIISNASICSVTLIDPSSEAMLEPTFPAKIKDTIVGENSSIKESRLAKPIIYVGSKGLTKLYAVWILITPPTKNDIITTILIEFKPIFSNSNDNCFLKTLHFFGMLKTLEINIK